MKKKIIYIFSILTIVVGSWLYLKIPLNAKEKLKLDIELSYKLQSKISLVLNEEVDYYYAFKNGVNRLLPFSQTVELRKIKYLEDLSYECGRRTFTKDEKELLNVYNNLSTKMLEVYDTNLKFETSEVLGYLIVVLVISFIIYLLSRLKTQIYKSYFIFIICTIYILNFILMSNRESIENEIKPKFIECFKSGYLN